MSGNTAESSGFIVPPESVGTNPPLILGGPEFSYENKFVNIFD